MKKTNRKWYFLRGLVREAGHWGSFVQEFKSRFPQDEIHCLDIPGCGVRYQEESLTSIAETVDALRSNEKNSKEPVYLFSLSLGAMIAIDWMARYPDEVAGGVFINTSFRSLSPFYKRLRWQNYLDILRTLLSQSAVDRERKIIEMVINSRDKRNEVLKDWVDLAKRHPVSKANAIKQIIAASRYRLPTLPSKPALILNASGDRFVDSQCSVQFHQKWTKSHFRTHPQAGHDLPMDAPKWVIDEVEKWLLQNDL
jgi:pimeloyl-ACP methyl ester carboxylesterase